MCQMLILANCGFFFFFFDTLGVEEKQMKELLEATNSTQHTYVHQVMHQNVPSSTMHSSQSWKPPKKSNTGRMGK